MNGQGITDIGKIREKNEDSFFISNKAIYGLPNLYIIADGMGGHNAGEIASKLSIDFFLEYLERTKYLETCLLDKISDATKYSNKKIYEESIKNKEYSGMGTTFTCCLVDNYNLSIVHIGDSRIYLFEDNTIKQITKDHTYINEMFELGKITETEMISHPKRNMLTKAMGTSSIIDIDSYSIKIDYGNKFLICSDGLTDMVRNEDINNIVQNYNLGESLDKLIDLAITNGGQDNITIILTETVGVNHEN